jgi:hypothetical protein
MDDHLRCQCSLAPSKPSHKVESWNLRFQFKRSFQNQNINHIHHLTFIRHGRSLLPVLLQPLLHLGSGLWPKPCQGNAAQLQALTPKKATYSDHTNRILDSWNCFSFFFLEIQWTASIRLHHFDQGSVADIEDAVVEAIFKAVEVFAACWRFA